MTNDTTLHLLTVGDNIITSGTKQQIKKEYEEALKKYKDDGRPSKEPNVWQWVKMEEKKK